jgi:hypothetical protein
MIHQGLTSYSLSPGKNLAIAVFVGEKKVNIQLIDRFYTNGF